MNRRPYTSREATFEDFARHVSPGKVAAYRTLGVDVVLGRRSGAVIEDEFSSRRWINCHCNGGVFNLGHRNPRVIEAISEALRSVDIGNHHLVSPYRAALARTLAETTGNALPGTVFGVAGGEAMDLAIKVVRGATDRQEIISANGAYHGHTGLALAAGDPQYREPFGPNLPGFRQVPFNDLAALEAAIGDRTAGVILETVPATLGMPIPDEDYICGVRRICSERGAMLVLDEVQSGLGRTGRFWAFEHFGITPDAIVTGKGLSGGIYPISATLMTRELHRFFEARPFVHLSTFGGADLGCIAALEVLRITREPGFLDHVRDLAERFAEGFRGLPFELRQLGLMMGFKFNDPEGGMRAARRLYKAGVFAVYANNDTSVTQFLPPLIISEAEADELVSTVRRTFS